MHKMKHTIQLMNKKKNVDKKLLFEQYKLICECADRVTDKRQNMNNFYLTVNSLALAIAGYLSVNRIYDQVSTIIGIIGVIICIVWWKNINSYKNLNTAKFKVIHELEKYLPAKIYAKEDQYLTEGYYHLTSSEKTVPVVFGILYALVFITNILIPLIKT